MWGPMEKFHGNKGSHRGVAIEYFKNNKKGLLLKYFIFIY